MTIQEEQKAVNRAVSFYNVLGLLNAKKVLNNLYLKADTQDDVRRINSTKACLHELPFLIDAIKDL